MPNIQYINVIIIIKLQTIKIITLNKAITGNVRGQHEIAGAYSKYINYKTTTERNISEKVKCTPSMRETKHIWHQKS